MPIVFPWVIDREESLSTLENHAHLFTHISPTWLKVKPDGSIAREEGQRVNAAAKAHDLKLVPLVGNEGFTPESAEQILVDPVVRRRVADELSEIVLDLEWHGITVDFEGPWAFRSEYTAFIQRLCNNLQPHGKLVALATAAQTTHPSGCGPEAAWTDPYDYPALGRLVDLFIPMGYDFHGVNTLPGPVGPAWWLQQVIQHTLSAMPRKKVVLGLPLYGYRWIQGKDGTWQGQYITHDRAEALREQCGVPLLWDYDALSRTFNFVDEAGQVNVVHYDDAASIRKRLELIRQHDLAGVAFWCLGLGDPAVWSALEDALQLTPQGTRDRSTL